MKKIILYIFLAFCLLGVIPLVLSLTSQTNSSSTSSSSSSVTTYSLTTISDEHSTIVVYDSNNTAVTSLQSGQEYTISVSVDEHYSLSSLKVNNVAYQNNSVIVPTSNITINSVSALQTFTLTKTGSNCTISILTSSSESVSSLTYGQTYTISVTASSGYQVDSITLNGTSVSNNSTFTASQNTTINVTTSLITYTLTKTGSNCTILVKNSSNESVSSLTYGQTYTISVTASSGYQVVGITLNGTSVSNNSTFTASQNTTLIVTTSLITYTLTTNGSNCTISVLNSNSESVSSLISGETYTISVTANSGYQVDSITLNGTSVSNNSTFTASQNITINVESLKLYTLSIGGSNYDTVFVLNSNNESVDYLILGETYTVSVTTLSGYEVDEISFLQFSTTTQSVYSTLMTVANNTPFVFTSSYVNVGPFADYINEYNTRDVVISVSAIPITYTLTTTGSNCTISVLNSSSESVNSLTHGQTYTISVTADSGYQVDSITLNGTSVSNNSTFTASQNTTIIVSIVSQTPNCYSMTFTSSNAYKLVNRSSLDGSIYFGLSFYSSDETSLIGYFYDQNGNKLYLASISFYFDFSSDKKRRVDISYSYSSSPNSLSSTTLLATYSASFYNISEGGTTTFTIYRENAPTTRSETLASYLNTSWVAVY